MREAPPVPSTALRTDRYELTMLDAALRSGLAEVPATFEVFTRRLPPGRTHGVFAGLGRLLDAVEAFRFDGEQLDWLAEEGVVSPDALRWLARYRFTGRIDAYREGELYTEGSPVLIVTGSFAETVLLETVVLSILNHDSAVAAAASLIVDAAGSRPVIEMGSRRTDPDAAVAAARAAYIGGFASTSNLDAGRRYGVPTAGTVSHAFVLAHPSEEEAFTAQAAAMGPGTTILVDTYDLEAGIRHAVAAAGPALGGIRIDSGDLAAGAARARRLLDDLGAPAAQVIVTGDLDDRSIAALTEAPVDGYGVGSAVVTGLGEPTAGLVYKLVAVGGTPVAKRSPGKATVGARKWAWRLAADQVPAEAEGAAGAGPGPVLLDLVATGPDAAPPGGRPLQELVFDGERRHPLASAGEARAFHRRVRSELPTGRPLLLARRGGRPAP